MPRPRALPFGTRFQLVRLRYDVARFRRAKSRVHFRGRKILARQPQDS
jgi:hypothetical protein